MSFRRRRTRARALTIGAALALCLAAVALEGQGPEPLFADGPVVDGLSAPAGAPASPYLVRSRIVTLRPLALLRGITGRTASFLLNLFPDTSLPLVFERTEASGFGHVSWIGHVLGRPSSTVTLTRKDGLLSGFINDGDRVYHIVPVGDDVQRVDELDTTAMPRAVDLVRAAGASGSPFGAPALGAPSAAATVDVFVFYTSALRAAVGVSQVQARVAQGVAQANSAYERSGVDGRLRLAGYAEIGLTDPDDPQVLLNSFTNNVTVRNTRDQTHADVVALLATGMSSAAGTIACGIGWVGPGVDAAFSVTASRPECIYSFVHEIGHNFGAQHATEDGVVEGPAFPAYARGYKAPDHAFRTVMAYPCTSAPSCPRTLNFSSPAVTLEGQPTGTATQDNARRLNETFALVATYRDPNATPQPPTAPRGLQVTTMGLTATLTWLPPVSGPPTTYRGALGTAPGLSDIGEQDIGPNTSVTVTLGAGTYYARIFAQNAVGVSPPSNEVMLVMAPLAPPGPPRGFVHAVSGDVVSMAWSPPTTGGSVYDYLLYAGSAPGASNYISGLSLFSTTASFSGIPPGRYYARMRARNAAGIGPPSNEIAIDVAAVCTVPSAPQGVTFATSGRTVTVWWAAPAVGGPGLSYILEAGSVPGSADYFNANVGAGTGLTAQVPPGTYYVRVRGAAPCGIGPASADVAIPVS